MQRLRRALAPEAGRLLRLLLVRLDPLPAGPERASACALAEGAALLLAAACERLCRGGDEDAAEQQLEERHRRDRHQQAAERGAEDRAHAHRRDDALHAAAAILMSAPNTKISVGMSSSPPATPRTLLTSPMAMPMTKPATTWRLAPSGSSGAA